MIDETLRDVIIKTATKVENIEQSMDELKSWTKGNTERINEHEKRLGKLPTMEKVIVGILLALIGMATWAIRASLMGQ